VTSIEANTECIGECRDRRGGADVRHAPDVVSSFQEARVWHPRHAIASASICMA
jgi:hypothetical protein